MIHPTNPKINELVRSMGETGKRLSEINASEGAAGNISVCMRWDIEPRSQFPVVETIELPVSVPELANAAFLVSGSGSRLRDIMDEPGANIGCIVIDEGGRTGKLHTSNERRFQRITSEFNSHLAVHYNQMLSRNLNFHAIIHAQPVHLTYLSHIPRYQDEVYLTRHLLRWQPETIINLPEGLGVVPFCAPSSAELMSKTVESLKHHRMVVWSRHGAMVRADDSIKHAEDLIEYAETAARYEYLNLASGEPADGLSTEDILEICKAFNVKQNIY